MKKQFSPSVLEIFDSLYLTSSILMITISSLVTGLLHDATERPMNFERKESGGLMLIVAEDEGNEPFNKQNWLHEKYEQIYEIKKVVKQRLLDNKTEEEVMELLGEPDNTYRPTNLTIFDYNFSNGGHVEYELNIDFEDGKVSEFAFQSAWWIW